MTESFSARLVAQDGTEHTLEGEMRVGRSADCELTIDDPRVSRNHAKLLVEGEKVTLEDLGSANGTLVNGQRLVGSTVLANGDEVQFDKYRFQVVTSGGAQAAPDDDRTVVAPPADDATVVGVPEPAAAPQPAPAPEPPPKEPPPAEPPPEEPKPTPSPAPAGSADLPGSWVDSGTGEHTQFLSMDNLGDTGSKPSIERASDLAHLIVVEEGVAGDVMELETGDGAEPDVWEIGREDSCEIMLDEPSVSARHAQLVHQGGRWRLVNLVSANGIFVNGEKRLTAYLGDGDEIRLGKAALVFHTAKGAAAPQPATPPPPSRESPAGGRKGLVIGAAVAVLVLVAAAYFLL